MRIRSVKEDLEKIGIVEKSYLFVVFSLFSIVTFIMVARGEVAMRTVVFALTTLGFVLLMRYPATLIAAVLVLPFLPVISYGGVTELMALLLLMACVIVWRLWWRISSILNLPVILWLIFFLYVVGNWYFSGQKDLQFGASRLKLFLIRGVGPMLVIMTLMEGRRHFGQFLFAVTMLSLLTVVMIACAYFGIGQITRTIWVSERIALFGLNPISLSLPVGISGVILAHYIFSSERVMMKFGAMLLAVPVSWAIFPTGTRQTVLSMVVGILTYTLLAYRSYFGKAFWSISAMAVILAGFIIITSNYQSERFDVTSKGYFESKSFQGRIETLKRGLKTFHSAPLFGVGTGGHGGFIYTVDPYTGKRVKDKEHIHNLAVELLAEQGLVGLFLFLLPLGIGVLRLLCMLSGAPAGHSRSAAAIAMALMVFALIQASISGGLGISGSFIVVLVVWMDRLWREMRQQQEVPETRTGSDVTLHEQPA